MAVSKLNPAATAKSRYSLSLTSGTSWTVPAGVTYVNVTLYGAAGGGGGVTNSTANGTSGGTGGTTTFTGATSAAGGAGGTLQRNNAIVGASGALLNPGLAGASMVTAVGFQQGGAGGLGAIVSSTLATTPGASITYAIGAGGAAGTGPSGANGGTGGAGKIDIEYWV